MLKGEWRLMVLTSIENCEVFRPWQQCSEVLVRQNRRNVRGARIRGDQPGMIWMGSLGNPAAPAAGVRGDGAQDRDEQPRWEGGEWEYILGKQLTKLCQFLFC